MDTTNEYPAFDFQSNVLEQSMSIPVIVQFSAASCGPCLFMEKQLIKITRNHPGKFEYVSLPTEQIPEIALKYGVRSNPSILFIYKTKEVSRLKGAIPDYAIEQWINDQLEVIRKGDKSDACQKTSNDK